MFIKKIKETWKDLEKITWSDLNSFVRRVGFKVRISFSKEALLRANEITKNILDKLKRANVIMAFDLFVAFLSVPVSLFLRIGEDAALYSGAFLFKISFVFALVSYSAFRFLGLNYGLWRYASFNDLVKIAKATTLITIAYFPLLFLLSKDVSLPRSLLVINWFVFTAVLGGARFFYRLYRDFLEGDLLQKEQSKNNILIVGATDDAELFLRDISKKKVSPYCVLGILDDRDALKNSTIQGVKVLSKIDELKDVLETFKKKNSVIKKVVVADENFRGDALKELVAKGVEHHFDVMRLPKITDLKGNDPFVLKPVAIEDLLGRAQATLDRDAMRQVIFEKSVLITGAGGSIGSELARQVAALSPKKIILFEACEYNLYSIEHEINDLFSSIEVVSVLGDVKDELQVIDVFEKTKPDIVFHAAAIKHVPIAEKHPIETVATNVLGTIHVADACVKFNVQAMVQISTDKAINPTSVMGASKRLAEMYTQALDVLNQNQKTHFTTVRFGNVLGSTGSIVPLFQKQLSKGGPLTVTHPEMTRYFMTIREAVELILQTSALGMFEQDARGKIFVLDMGRPVKILDLARQMIQLAGLEENKDVRIHFTGIRPGEKLFEELFHEKEATTTKHSGVLLASPRLVVYDDLMESLMSVVQKIYERDEQGILKELHALVPEYDVGKEASKLKIVSQ